MSATTYSKKNVLLALRETIQDPLQIRRVIECLAAKEGVEKEGEAEKEPPVKKQFSILVSDPRGIITTDLVGWVVQIPENDNPATVIDRINRACDQYSTSKKGRLYPLKTIGESMEGIPGKFWKEVGLTVKTKVPVLVVRTNNEIAKLEHA